MRGLLGDAAERATRYLEGLDGRAVAPDPAAVSALAALDTPFPESGSDDREVLELLDRYCSPATMAMAGGRFFGFVIGGALPVAVAANWLATAWDQNTGLYNSTPATARLEEVALRWLVELFGLPAGTGGAFVTGATVANFTALAAARHTVLQRAGWDVEADGLFGAPAVTIVVGAEAHPSVIKALGLLGFGRDRIVRTPVDDQGRLRIDSLPTLSGPSIVCAQVGNVNTGACDPVPDIAARLRDGNNWLHVDGAFGLWAAAAPSMASLVRGIDQADSWATDAHKWLNVPYDSGLAFVRDPEALRGDGDHRRLPADPVGIPQSIGFHPGAVEAGAWRRYLGRVAQPGQAGRRRTRRTQLPPGAAIRRKPAGTRLRGTQRGRAQPGTGLVRRRGDHPESDRHAAGGRDLLVWRHGLAGTDRDAHQRLVLGHHGCRRGPQPRSDAARVRRGPRVSGLIHGRPDANGASLAAGCVGRGYVPDALLEASGTQPRPTKT